MLDLKKPGEYPYLVMGEGGESELHRGRPPYGSMGDEISFPDLPQACREVVLDHYRALWNLPEPSAPGRETDVAVGSRV